MAFWYVTILVAVGVAHANAGCILPPPLPPPSALLPGILPPGLLPASCLPAAAPLPFLPAYGPAPLPAAFPLPAPLPFLPAPACASAPIAVPVKKFQQPDMNIPLPLPAEINLGKYCSCRKFGITPSLVAPPVTVDGPTETINVPEPPPPAALAPPAAPALNPAALQTLLSLLPAPAAPAPCAAAPVAPACGCL